MKVGKTQSLFDLVVLPLWKEKGNTANNDLSFPLRKRNLMWILCSLLPISEAARSAGNGSPSSGRLNFKPTKGEKKGHGYHHKSYKSSGWYCQAK